MKELFFEIDEKVSRFCNSKPLKGFELDYLQKSKEVQKLYSDAYKAVEEEDIERLKTISKELDSLI